MKFVCVGHSTFDTTLPVNEFPIENTKNRINDHIECGGGPASNGAYLLAKWGMDTTIVSIVGDDYYGTRVIADFAHVGANTDYLEVKKGHLTSSSYIIANMSNGSRTIITSKKPPIRKLTNPVKVEADVILLDGEHPETANEVLENNPNAISILDAGRFNDDTKYLGKKVNYVVCSKEFAEEFTEQEIDLEKPEHMKEIHKKLEDYFNTTIVITLESKGSYTKIDGNYKIIPTVKVKAIDSTGAGDIFHGAFTYFIANGYSLEETIRLSSITAAISVTRVGSRYSIPLLSEVLEYNDAI